MGAIKIQCFLLEELRHIEVPELAAHTKVNIIIYVVLDLRECRRPGVSAVDLVVPAGFGINGVLLEEHGDRTVLGVLHALTNNSDGRSREASKIGDVRNQLILVQIVNSNQVARLLHRLSERKA